jgi:hypothetical protein
MTYLSVHRCGDAISLKTTTVVGIHYSLASDAALPGE